MGLERATPIRERHRDAQLDRIEALVLTLLAQVGRIEAVIAAGSQKAPRVISAADRRTLATLLPAWFEATKGAACRASEIAPYAPATMSTKSLGKLLARAEGIGINGLAIERVGVEGHVALWRVGLV
jgi:hypothetical protein